MCAPPRTWRVKNSKGGGEEEAAVGTATMVTICMVPHASPAPALIDKSSATARPPEVMTFLEPDWPTGCNSSSCPTNWWRSTAEEHLLPGKE
ncbi:hypothetical protein Bca52824_069248 [Brassica carinata]|uniref:Uncharacterized protein n=1 Tax=Brassica carinata TaxID=52824 RepID=A0A8X7U1Y8_BRACI|nr:hypothetical protein Bca52824_069248 [Brassica carinata]